MSSKRKELLMELVKDQPNDPFVPYALGLECIKYNTQEALEWFRRCHDNFPDYLPNYYHYANLLAELDDEDQATAVFEQGIELASVQKDDKTLSELRTALLNWQLEWDDL